MLLILYIPLHRSLLRDAFSVSVFSPKVLPLLWCPVSPLFGVLPAVRFLSLLLFLPHLFCHLSNLQRSRKTVRFASAKWFCIFLQLFFELCEMFAVSQSLDGLLECFELSSVGSPDGFCCPSTFVRSLLSWLFDLVVVVWCSGRLWGEKTGLRSHSKISYKRAHQSRERERQREKEREKERKKERKKEEKKKRKKERKKEREKKKKKERKRRKKNKQRRR